MRLRYIYGSIIYTIPVIIITITITVTVVAAAAVSITTAMIISITIQLSIPRNMHDFSYTVKNVNCPYSRRHELPINMKLCHFITLQPTTPKPTNNRASESQ